MLYLQGEGLKIIVLEQGNIDQLLQGRPAHTPDKSVLIAFTPDPVWLADRLEDSGGDARKIAQLIDEASKRPPRPANRPTHKTRTVTFGG